MPAASILRLARTSRWAIVGSATRNARAISAVVRPPSVRSVSATCASTASAGWQQVKISSSRSSGKVGLVHRVLRRRRHLAAACVFSASVRSRRSRSIARLRAGRDQPGAGIGRDAVARPALGGDGERLLRGLLGEVEVAEEADQRGEHAAPLVAEDLLERSLPLHDRAHLDRAAHARGRDPRRQLDGRVEVVGLEDQVAAERLLGLDERAVGGQRLAVLRRARWWPSPASAAAGRASRPGSR